MYIDVKGRKKIIFLRAQNYTQSGLIRNDAKSH